MNRIVRENYPVADLPEDLRNDLSNVEHVRGVLDPLAPKSVSTRPSLDDARRAPPSLTPANPIQLDVDALLCALDA